MRSWWLIAIACAGCKSKHVQEAPPAAGSGSAVAVAPAPVAAPVDAAPVAPAPDPHTRLCMFTDKGYVYIDATGNQAFPGLFEYERDFTGGRACVDVNKNQQLIDETGKVVAKRKGGWCGLMDFTDGFGTLDDKIYDLDGKPVATVSFQGKKPDELHQFSEGLAAARFGIKWGFVDHAGKMVIAPAFGPEHEWTPGSDSDMSDADGNPVPGPDYYDYVREFHDGLAPVRQGDKWGYIDKTGAFAIHPRFTELAFKPEFHDGLAKFRDDNGKLGFMDHTGKAVIAATADDATPFAEGLAGVQRGDHWEYVDKTGKTVIKLPPEMTYGDSFSEGLAMIRKGVLGKDGTRFCFIDHTGAIVIPCTFARGGTFHGGVAEVDGIEIDRTGKKLWPK